MKVGTCKRLQSAAEEVVKKFELGTVTKYRVVTALWKHILLHNMDDVKTSGGSIKLVAKPIGAGVWEIEEVYYNISNSN